MADVTLKDIRKVYPGGVEAVKDIDFAIPDGGFCVLVGPSGCGKSTLLRMIAGLETITDGECRIGGRIVNDVEPADRDIAMVFQNYALYPHMTVYNNMAYGLRNRKTPEDEIARRVAEAARILAIEPFLDRKPRALSGGQRQRVAMGRAIVRKPQVFLFDEPLSNLDAKLRVHMRVEIKKLHNSLKVTSIYVTHDQVEAMTLADMIVVMSAGRIEQIGTPADVYSRPESVFVATFIGSPAMNLVKGEVVADGQVSLAGTRLACPTGAAAAGTEVLIGVRPDEVTLDPTGPFHSAFTFIEELGPSRLYHGQIAGQDFVVQAPHHALSSTVDSLHFAIDVRAVHLFEAKSGKRIMT
ncbi:MAG TPA: sn-glycerol-3-phosphate import ATP-binding protein UgpC [Beijerinckiaceae bacterium]|nr:sn-glycerol-3-phosphate import ATP-binding protein UgpC [Beijerinckiaceae bacterium]